MKIQYAHLIKNEREPLPFELRTIDVSVRRFPPDEIDETETFQIMRGGKAISDALPTVRDAANDAAYNLMNQSRGEYARS